MAPGPSLDLVTAKRLFFTGWHTLACQDAYKVVPWAHKLYGCDAKWWDAHAGMDFPGEKWASHNNKDHSDDKLAVAEKYGLNLVKGYAASGFSTDPGHIHYGENSGFQAINLALLLGADYIVLIGFDMRHVGGKSHFFGDHPQGLFQRNEYQSFVKNFENAPAPPGTTIINATCDSALKCYPLMSLDEAIENYCVHRYRSIVDARADRDRETEGHDALRVQPGL